MTPLQIYKESTLTEKQLVSTTRLLYEVFVTDERTFEEVLIMVKERIEKRKGTPGESTRVVIWENEEPVAHAGYFGREIFTPTGAIYVGALWGVCVWGSHRGKGLGRQIVQPFLDQIERGTFPVGLWQTEVPDFYNKLGARIIANPFINSQDLENPQDPWPDEVKMIYPATYPWPEGPIDLNGPAY